MKVVVDILGSPSVIVLMVSVDVKQHRNLNNSLECAVKGINSAKFTSSTERTLLPSMQII